MYGQAASKGGGSPSKVITGSGKPGAAVVGGHKLGESAEDLPSGGCAGVK